MEEPEREVSVVREEQRPRRAEVEPPHWNDAGTDAFRVLRDGGSPRRIAHGAHHVPRFVKHQVNLGFSQHRTTVHGDPVLVRIRLRAELGDDTSVDRHTARKDELLGFSPGSHASAGQDLLQTFTCHDGGALPERWFHRYCAERGPRAGLIAWFHRANS